jgi:hypothetical protein
MDEVNSNSVATFAVAAVKKPSFRKVNTSAPELPAAAISAARVGRLYYGAADPKSGGVAVGARVFSHPQCHHAPEVYDGIGALEAETLLKAFFAERR